MMRRAVVTARRSALLRKPQKSHGRSDNLSDLVRSVEKLFGQKNRGRKFVPTPAAATTPVCSAEPSAPRPSKEELPAGEKCLVCASHLRAERSTSGSAARVAYRSRPPSAARRLGARRERRFAAASATPPIPEAANLHKQLCPDCKRANRKANCARNYQRKRAGTTGRRGTNQFGRVEK
jgi:hypothetical protein